MKRSGWLLILVVGFAAGCSSDSAQTADSSDISARAREALPEWVNLEDVLKDNTGCYAYFDRGAKWVRPVLEDQGRPISVPYTNLMLPTKRIVET